MIGILTWGALLALGGCAFIPASHHEERLASLVEDGDGDDDDDTTGDDDDDDDTTGDDDDDTTGDDDDDTTGDDDDDTTGDDDDDTTGDDDDDDTTGDDDDDDDTTGDDDDDDDTTGDDDDDDEPECESGDAAPPADEQRGVCAGATKACVDGAWEEPDYTAIAGYGPEVCDGLDNDCNGEDDDIPVDDHPPADKQDGVCFGATKVCDGSGWVEPDYAEHSALYAVTELCDGYDNDCNGEDDDVPAGDVPLANLQDGVCQGAVKVCNGTNGWGEPDYADHSPYFSSNEICDGLDNDCIPTTGEAGLVSREGQTEVSLAVAVANAASGDTILVCEGEHRGHFAIGSRDLTIQGLAAREDIRLKPPGSGTVLTVGSGGALTLSSVTVTEATSSGLSATDADFLVFDDVVFTKNDGTHGGGLISVGGAPVTITDSLFQANSVTGAGGGLYVLGPLTVSSTEFVENLAAYGGAIYGNNGSAYIAGSNFAGNKATGQGGAIRSGVLQDLHLGGPPNQFTNNSAGADGGAISKNLSALTASGDTFTSNTAGGTGGAIHITGAAAQLSSNTFTNNQATLEGGAVSVIDSNDIGMIAATLDQNSAFVGGAVYCQGSSLTLDGVTASYNYAHQGGAAYLQTCDGVVQSGAFFDNYAYSSGNPGAGGALMLGWGELHLDAWTHFGNGGSSSPLNSPDDVGVWNTPTHASYSWAWSVGTHTVCVKNASTAICSPPPP